MSRGKLKKKKDNIILFNIPESENDDQDVDHIKEIISHVSPDATTEHIDSTVVRRIGSKKDDQTRPRPIKVKILQPDQKQKLLKKC